VDRHPPGVIVLDMDFGREPDLDEQESSAYTAIRCTCYYPLFLFN